MKTKTQQSKFMGCGKSNIKKREFIVINVCIKEAERSQDNNLILHLMEPEKETN